MTVKQLEEEVGMKKHLTGLKSILKGNEKKRLFACIEDLALNGVDPKRFSGEEFMPTRQDATQFILKWFHHIGVPPNECRNWMIGFAVDVLSEISASSASRIRHSTKSNMKFVYKSGVPFECGCEENFFKARCDSDCLLYEEMHRLAKRKKKKVHNWEVDHSKMAPPAFTPPPSLKEKFKEQFDEAMKLVAERVEQGLELKAVLELLHEKDFKTRTGKKWTLSSLRFEMRKNSIKYTRRKSDEPYYSPVKEKYHEQFKEAMEIVREKVIQDVKLVDILTWLTENGYKTRTGRLWQFSTLRVEMKKHNIEYASNIVKLKPMRSRVRKNYKNQFDKAMKTILQLKKRDVSITDTAAHLNERGFVTRTGRKWTYGNVRNELIRHKNEQHEQALEIVREKVEKGEALEDILKHLNSSGLETKTGRPWHISILKAEVKRRGFKPEAPVKSGKKGRTSLTKMYRKQFEKALETILTLHRKGNSAESIAEHLNEKELKTRTGKKWSAGNVHNEVRRHRKETGGGRR